MKAYDYIVVGSGITGLTMARLLSLRPRGGAKVLVLEKARTLGGSTARFRLRGVPFDVGFHFTGGFTEDGSGVLDDMLRVLGVRKQIRPVFFPAEHCHRVILPSVGADYVLASGVDRLQQQLMRDFPRQRDGVARYFGRMRHVVSSTPTLTVAGLEEPPVMIDEDGVSAKQVMDECITDPVLQALLSGFCMCYGSRLDEISFANHARICFGLHETLARVEDNGQAFVDALVGALKQDGVEIRTNVSIASLGEIENRICKRVVLSDGEEVEAGACILTMHPRNILAILPQGRTTPAFRNRVNDFEESIAFFALFGLMAGEPGTGAEGAEASPITSVFPDVDLSGSLRCRTEEAVDGPLVVIGSTEKMPGGRIETSTVLEVSFPQWTRQWADSVVGKRPAAYYQWKKRRVESILGRLSAAMPEYAARMQVLEAASNLTFRDYLNSPDGSAYGIRHKVGQFDLVGRLPVTNFYAAGQSALLPGIIGAMTSAFLVCRMLVGREGFKELLARRVCP